MIPWSGRDCDGGEGFGRPNRHLLRPRFGEEENRESGRRKWLRGEEN